MDILYKNIKKRRQELGMSQQALAEAVGYSGKSMIAQVEKGNVDLSISMIVKFAQALKTKAPELMGYVEPKPDGYDFRLDDDSQIIIEQYKNLPSMDKEIVKKFIIGASMRAEDIENEELGSNVKLRKVGDKFVPVRNNHKRTEEIKNKRNKHRSAYAKKAGEGAS